MDISKFKIVWKYLFGGIGSVVDYLLEILNTALAALDPAKKEKVQAVLNLALKVLAALKTLQFLCPVKWQTAYGLTVKAVQTLVTDLEDLNVTQEEMNEIIKEFKAAVEAWKSPDDATCVDCEDLLDDLDDCSGGDCGESCSEGECEPRK